MLLANRCAAGFNDTARSDEANQGKKPKPIQSCDAPGSENDPAGTKVGTGERFRRKIHR
jgi:hypothetical protein